MAIRVCEECIHEFVDSVKTRPLNFWHRCLTCKAEMDWEILVREVQEKIEKSKTLREVVLLGKTIDHKAEMRFKFSRYK